MKELLTQGNIVIAAGFQGIDENLNITTLGRGGSDTTAVALAAVLGAASCEIYTDVDGVYTTDPRLLPEARRVPRISYDEMLELASLGAGVMHNRAVEFGKKYQVPIHVRSSFSDIEGTMIIEEPETWSQPVAGCASTKNESRISLYDVPDVPGTLWEIFYRMADLSVTVDMVVQNIGGDGKADVSFTVPSHEHEAALVAAREAALELGGAEVDHDSEVAKISVVGVAMAEETGVATKMFDALNEAGVNIIMITTSEIKISVLVSRDDANRALRVVHKAFDLDSEPTIDNEEEAAAATRRNRPKIDPADWADRLANLSMEELFIGDIALDDEQARLTVEGIPNRPGIAAQLFRRIAEADIFVDMIVQSFNSAETAEISFTVPVEQYAAARETTERVAKEMGCTRTSASESVAKLSVFGIGLQSHTGVGLRMFERLAKAGINIEIVSTSEVRVNVVVDSADGDRALQELQEEFAEFRRAE